MLWVAAMALKILTVEDAPNIRKLIAYNLKRAGYEVTEAEDGKAAVRVLQSCVPDLILLDIRMPEMDGFQLLELLRKYPKAAAIPVIMLTALSSAADLERAINLGVVDYLVKPLDPTLLLSKVDIVLRRGEPTVAGAVTVTWGGENRRQFARASIHGCPLLPTPGGLGVNLSEGGLAFTTRNPVDAREMITMNAPSLMRLVGLSEATLRIRVVYCVPLHDGYYRVGAAFIGLPESTHNALRRFVLEHQSRFAIAGP